MNSAQKLATSGSEKSSSACRQGTFCGSDGITYSNECDILSPVYKDCDGDCPCVTSGSSSSGNEAFSSYTPTEFPLVNGAPPTVRDECPMCPLVYVPVCGVNGMTYYSDCERDCRGSVLKECDGECPCPVIPTSEAAMFTGLITPTEQYPSATEAPFCSCPGNVYSPVCGVDGQVYDNPCLLACEGVVQACEGVCPCNQAAPSNNNDMFVPAFMLAYSQSGCSKCLTLDYEPVCGSDGSTYRNECYAKCNGVDKQCSSSCPCNS